MRSHLEGEARMIWDSAGLRCEITVPAARVLAAGPVEDGPPTVDAAAAAPARGSETLSLKSRRVMVVEDEPLLALEIAATLQELGCEVVGPATSLPEALCLGDAEAAQLDAAVMDVNLRGHASFPIADLLARHGVAIIYVSGYASLAGIDAAADGPRPTLLRKPLHDGDLANALRHALAQRERDRIIEVRVSS